MAIELSEMDKIFREANLIDTGNVHQQNVDNDGRKSIVYYAKEAEYKKTDTQIDTVRESIRNRLEDKSGWLFKNSPHWLQGYDERWCTLSNRSFRYYSKTMQLQGVLNFDLQTYILLEEKKDKLISISLKPLGSDKVFQFKGKDLEQWAKLINQHLEGSHGRQKALQSLTKIQRFWRTECISLEQFQEEAQEGDLLLFRGKDINCKIQRTFTQSDYDHVALLIRLEYDHLYFFEALPLHGVGLCRWGTFVQKKWDQLYDKICIRKLNCNRDYIFKTKLHDFVNNNVGKRYSLNPNKLLRFTSEINPKKKDERTYFCSELVAKCYKELDLLPAQKSSTQYWPGSFASDTNIQLTQGALSTEYVIDFTQ